ncbi:MAG: hypothetical protein RIR70_1121 [Pseudomonadota bacterium]|jgi:energy-coupling factor transporter transmembrane protein EcfT
MLHPSVTLLLWLAGVLLAQAASGAWALGLCALAALFALLRARERFLGLIRRTRYLLIALVVIFAFFTPGYLIWPQLGWASPSAEGLAHAQDHACRLIFVLAMVAWLLAAFTPQQLIGGLHGVCWPLGLLGLDRERAAVRLSLVLDYTAHARAERSWREWLEFDSPAPSNEIEIPRMPLNRADALALALLITLAAMALTRWL